jgi:hypothetical protein
LTVTLALAEAVQVFTVAITEYVTFPDAVGTAVVLFELLFTTPLPDHWYDVAPEAALRLTVPLTQTGLGLAVRGEALT